MIKRVGSLVVAVLALLARFVSGAELAPSPALALRTPPPALAGSQPRAGWVAVWGRAAAAPRPAETVVRGKSAAILKVSPWDLPAFLSAGFEPLSELRVRVTWSRVSRGMASREWRGEQTYNAVQLEDAFARLRGFESDPLALLARDPEGNAYIRARGEVSLGEREYAVVSAVSVSTGRAVLFESVRRSPSLLP